MTLRPLRWLTAIVASSVIALAAPSRAEAGVQILIQELDSGGGVVPGTTSIFLGTSVLGYSTQNFFDINVTVNTTSGVLNPINSMTTPIGLKPVTNFDTSRQIRVIVTDDGFLNPNPGQRSTVQNNAGASSGIIGGQNAVTAVTSLLQVPLNPGTNQTSNVAAGTLIATPTAPATDIRPSNATSPTTARDIDSLPGQYAMQQTILVRALNVQAGGVAAGSTLGGTASSVILAFQPAAVPAPSGLLLALVALPVFGLRRLFGKKPTA